MAITEDQESVKARAVAAPPRKRMSLQRREALWGMGFLTPWLIGMVIFTSLPIIASLALSLTNFNIIHPNEIRFIGLDNYSRMWTELWHNGNVGISLSVTARFALMALPLGIGLSLGLALLLNQKLLAAKAIWRTMFFMPVQIPIVATTLVWGGFLNGSTGWLAMMFRFVGLPTNHWFSEPAFALMGLVLMGIWGIGNGMLIFLAGLQGIPTELYEAVKVDGGGVWARFRHVTLPMISPVLFYNILIGFIGISQYFTQAYVIDPGGNGAPGGSTLFYNMNLYKEAWVYNNMGYGSALAWLMMFFVVIISIMLFRSSARWVFYAGGDK
jgi:multiple sugar transport system permease protein